MTNLLYILIITYLIIMFYLPGPWSFKGKEVSFKKLFLQMLIAFCGILLVSVLASSFFHLPSYHSPEPSLKWILAILFLMEPAAEIIKVSLLPYQVSKIDDAIPNAGRLIGILERLILLLLLTQNQYGAIGFVLTAKSIARYNKIAESPEFAESYLLGTLLSSLLAIICFFLVF